jgi:hypothetical protein
MRLFLLARLVHSLVHPRPPRAALSPGDAIAAVARVTRLVVALLPNDERGSNNNYTRTEAARSPGPPRSVQPREGWHHHHHHQQQQQVLILDEQADTPIPRQDRQASVDVVNIHQRDVAVAVRGGEHAVRGSRGGRQRRLEHECASARREAHRRVEPAEVGEVKGGPRAHAGVERGAVERRLCGHLLPQQRGGAG